MVNAFKSSFNVNLQNYVWKVQAAQTKVLCQMEIEILQRAHPVAAEYLDSIGHEKWALCTQIGKLKLDGWHAMYFVKSENSAVVLIHMLFPFEFFCDVMDGIAK
jgi:hypothetical protein